MMVSLSKAPRFFEVAEQIAQDAFHVFVEIIALRMSSIPSMVVLASSLSSSSNMENSPELWLALGDGYP